MSAQLEGFDDLCAVYLVQREKTRQRVTDTLERAHAHARSSGALRSRRASDRASSGPRS